MHRTQLLIEERQYRGLMSLARRENTSLSGLVRKAVDALLGTTDVAGTKGSRLENVRGMFRDAGASGRDHDAVLYGGTSGKPGKSG